MDSQSIGTWKRTLEMYRQQWQADQQKQIIAQMAGKIPSKSNDGKRKIVI
jgi:hypothetical protein